MVTKTEWNDHLKTWTVEINTDGKGIRILEMKHLVFATGFGGHPKSPDTPGNEHFKGKTSVLLDSPRQQITLGKGR